MSPLELVWVLLLGALTVLWGVFNQAIEVVLDKEYPTWAPPLARRLIRWAGWICRSQRDEWWADLLYLQEVEKEAGLLRAGHCLLSSPWLALREAGSQKVWRRLLRSLVVSVQATLQRTSDILSALIGFAVSVMGQAARQTALFAEKSGPWGRVLGALVSAVGGAMIGAGAVNMVDTVAGAGIGAIVGVVIGGLIGALGSDLEPEPNVIIGVVGTLGAALGGALGAGVTGAVVHAGLDRSLEAARGAMIGAGAGGMAGVVLLSVWANVGSAIGDLLIWLAKRLARGRRGAGSR